MNYCSSCGAQLQPGASFCANCGTALAGNQQQPLTNRQQWARTASEVQTFNLLVGAGGLIGGIGGAALWWWGTFELFDSGSLVWLLGGFVALFVGGMIGRYAAMWAMR